MDFGRLVLAFGLILAPPLAYSVFLVVYNHHRRARRDTSRPTVAEVIDRATRENRSSGDAGQAAEIPPRLPPGWHWPARDCDDPPQPP